MSGRGAHFGVKVDFPSDTFVLDVDGRLIGPFECQSLARLRDYLPMVIQALIARVEAGIRAGDYGVDEGCHILDGLHVASMDYRYRQRRSP